MRTVPLALGNIRQKKQQAPKALRTIIYLSNAARNTMQRLGSGWEGVPSTVLQNFLPDKPRFAVSKTSAGHYWLYAGRLSAEKGVAELVTSWPADFRLVIAGSGPLGDGIAMASATKQIELRGQLSPSEVESLMERATGLIFPSLWQEQSPMVVIEALRAGVPVLARSGNVVSAELVRSGAGLSFSNPQELFNALTAISMNRGRFAANARRLYEQNHTEQRWVRALTSVYAEVTRQES